MSLEKSDQTYFIFRKARCHRQFSATITGTIMKLVRFIVVRMSRKFLVRKSSTKISLPRHLLTHVRVKTTVQKRRIRFDLPTVGEHGKSDKQVMSVSLWS